MQLTEGSLSRIRDFDYCFLRNYGVANDIVAVFDTLKLSNLFNRSLMVKVIKSCLHLEAGRMSGGNRTGPFFTAQHAPRYQSNQQLFLCMKILIFASHSNSSPIPASAGMHGLGYLST